MQAFFFSVDTVATIGYGNIVPATFLANLLVPLESLVGLLGFSVVAGIVFARFGFERRTERCREATPATASQTREVLFEQVDACICPR